MSDTKIFASHGWKVVFVGFGMYLILGTLYAWRVIGKALAAQWQWSKMHAALPLQWLTFLG